MNQFKVKGDMRVSDGASLGFSSLQFGATGGYKHPQKSAQGVQGRGNAATKSISSENVSNNDANKLLKIGSEGGP